MTAYLIRRTLTAIVVLLGVSVFIFLMLHVIYPTPAIQVLGPHANKFSINQWNQQHGFDDPWIVQYLRYLNQLLHGNLGYSYKLNQSVLALFQERWMRSAYLSGITLFLSVVIAIPLGIYQAVRRNTVGDGVVTTGAFVTYAMPDFFLYLIAIQLLAISFPIFSFEGPQTTSMMSIIFNWRAMTLPDRLPDPAGPGRVTRGTCGRRRWTRWPRTTSRRPGPRGCLSAWYCSGIWYATRSCR